MNIQLLPALNGDCILVEHAPGHYFLIDGGYVDTYKKYLSPKLRAIAAEGGVIDVLVVTHIDEDHISGINKMMESHLPIPVGEIWYNGYRHIQSNAPVSEGRERVIHHEILKEAEPDPPPMMVPYSARQGCSLSMMINMQEIPWNVPAQGGVMKAPMSYQVGESMVHFLSPNQDDISSLENFWRQSLVRDNLLERAHSQEYWDDAFEFGMSKHEQGFREHVVASKMDMMRKEMIVVSQVEEALSKPYEPDSSAPNGSSISFVLESGNTRVLFLGDAHSETVVESLQALYGAENKPYHFDAVKLAHHGSFHNNSPKLLDLITSDKWLVSTNGDKFGHPELPTLAHIVSRCKDSKFYFNYDLKVCDVLRKDIARGKYGYEVITPEKDAGIGIEVGEKEDGADIAVPECKDGTDKPQNE